MHFIERDRANGEEMMERKKAQYEVIFLGPMAKDLNIVNKLVNNLQIRCHLSVQVVTKMMRLAPLTVKKGVNLTEAQRYKTALEEMGARVTIELMDEAGVQTEQTDTIERKRTLTK